MMRQHQLIHKNEQSKNRRIRFLLLLLCSACVVVPKSEYNEILFDRSNVMPALSRGVKFSAKKTSPYRGGVFIDELLFTASLRGRVKIKERGVSARPSRPLFLYLLNFC